MVKGYYMYKTEYISGLFLLHIENHLLLKKSFHKELFLKTWNIVKFMKSDIATINNIQ